MTYKGLTVVIPTRNRASLAITAIRSVLEQPLEEIQILVSDNSTITSEADQLLSFCNGLSRRGVRYIVPPHQMPMTQHWNWVMGRALDTSESSHTSFLTDRMIFKTNELTEAIKIVQRYPDRIVCYNNDTVFDNIHPVRLGQVPWTGDLFEIRTDQLLALVARATLHNSLPRMLNSIVPNSDLEAVRSHFGSVFGSIAPDFCFCFRVLAIFDSLLFLDRPVLLQYALYRSNGENGALGRKTGDHLDFITQLSEDSPDYAVPVPQIATVFNGICHEYSLVKEESNFDKFPDIAIEPYLNFLAHEIERIEDSDVRRNYRDLLESQGWRHTKDEDLRSLLRRVVSLSTIVNRIKWLAGLPLTKTAWLTLADLLPIKPPSDNRFGFQTTEEAMGYAERFPRKKEPKNRLREPLSSTTTSRLSLDSHQELRS